MTFTLQALSGYLLSAPGTLPLAVPFLLGLGWVDLLLARPVLLAVSIAATWAAVDLGVRTRAEAADLGVPMGAEAADLGVPMGAGAAADLGVRMGAGTALDDQSLLADGQELTRGARKRR